MVKTLSNEIAYNPKLTFKNEFESPKAETKSPEYMKSIMANTRRIIRTRHGVLLANLSYSNSENPVSACAR